MRGGRGVTGETSVLPVSRLFQTLMGFGGRIVSGPSALSPLPPILSTYFQHRGALDLAGPQAVQGLIGCFQGEDLHLGFHRHLRGDF